MIQPTIVCSAARTMHYPLSQQGFALRVSIDFRRQG
jgi:hypothetical protein